MESDGLIPSRVMYTSLIGWYCKEEEIKRAKGVYKRMLKMGCCPDVKTCTTLIFALYKENRVDEAEDLFFKMFESGIAPDHVMYNSLKKHPKGGNLSLTMMILLVSSFVTSHLNKHMKEDVELWFRKFLVSNKMCAYKMCFSYDDFTTLISALCVGGKTNLAWDFLDKMGDHGFEPSLLIYNSIITCFCRDGSFEDAKKLIDLMEEEQGILPNLATYLIMVNEHCKQGNLSSALKVIEEMNDMVSKPSVAIYDSIVGALCNDERLVEADYNMFKGRMLKAGVVADEVVYTTLISGYSKNGKPIHACRLFDEMIESGIKPSPHAYAALINGLVKKNMTEKGCHYLTRMLNDGFVPDSALYTILINQFCRRGDVSFALSLYHLMSRNEIGINLITYGSLISDICRNIS